METIVRKPSGKKIAVVPAKISRVRPTPVEPLQGDDNLIVAEITEQRGMGWLPDYPDFRDYSPNHVEIKKLFKGTRLAGAGLSLPPGVDLRPWCSPIENQGALGSCTANAGAGVIEYLERKAYGNHIDASRLFLYKATRNYMQVTGDTGAYLRTTMGAMVLFGVAPEKYWPYNILNFDVEPPAFCYSFANNYKAIKYYRLDPSGTPRAVILNNVKTNLAAQLPSMFGFSVFKSFYQAQITGKVPIPAMSGDPWIGGHAVVAVGYDDTIRIKNAIPGSVETVGALLIRNSWGLWGPMGGYLWMPYDYILKGLATDFWSLISADYINTGNFNV
jgi:C1A family cysteine protease